MTTVLITGFGLFPGAPFNPSAPLARAVAQRRRPALADVRRVLHIFETSYAAVDRDLPKLIATHKPDIVLMLPGAGDELQGIKKGVVEIADMIAVNKADGDNVKRAKAAAGEYRAALHILTPRSPTWAPPVVTYSALTGDGIDTLWSQALAHRQQLSAVGEFAARRREQQVKWMWAMLEDRFRLRLKTDAKLKARVPAIERAVADGTLSPALAVEEIAGALGV